MNKHTPGPWQQVSRNINELQQTFHGVRAGSFYFDIPTGCELQDARLIAAAPDLLEALEEAISMLGSRLIKDTFGYDWHEKATAAIARARGES